MKTLPLSSTPASAEVKAAIDSALARIPPLWPLRHFVAVNPFVGLADRPFTEAAALLQRVTGAAPLQSADSYREAYVSGRIQAEDLADASDEAWSPAALIAALENASAGTDSAPLATVADLLDRTTGRAYWSRFVVDEISKWCAVTFDENQTTWTNPWKNDGLYASWRAAAAHDHTPEIHGLTGFRAFVESLPEDPLDAITACESLIDRGGAGLTDWLHRQLVSIAGWAGHVQYRVREDALRGRANPMLTELLAIRLAYDAGLFRAFAARHGLAGKMRQAATAATDARTLAALVRWQLAYEAGYQRRLGQALAGRAGAPRADRAPAQAVFCIDVRSEVFRRHLEAALPGVQTIGFAGFFGFPVAHIPEAGDPAAARCPVLLVPPVETCEPLTPSAVSRRKSARAAAGAWKAFQNSAASCFSFVESVGLGYGAALGRSSTAGRLSCSRVAPGFAEATAETRAKLAAGALRNMSLVKNFARLVLICGHGSESANNPYASGLDCGACGGHAGDVNARLAAATLNDPDVRRLLAAQGLVLPSDTLFVAGLHNTTTDDVLLYDLENVPATHRDDVARLRAALVNAGVDARRERASALGLNALADGELDSAIRERAVNIAQVRPEWGLANNAALVAAPRSRTAGLKLDGRVFLHDYDAALDADDSVLTLILCAPVVVASWINLQYYASRIDPERYGSGNKVLHNVVGGLGVLEGNSGDLKVGLPLQSIHDGHAFMHEPRRLSVYIEAQPERILAVLEKNPGVRQLFDNQWLHLFSLQGSHCLRYRAGHFAVLPAASSSR
jgi:uncharacterized protein